MWRIRTPSLAVQKLFPLSVLLAAILNFGSLPSPTNVDQHRLMPGSVISVTSKSGVVDNVGQPLQSRRNQLPFETFESYFQFRFQGRHLESVLNNVGRHRLRHIQVGRGRTYGGTRLNFVSMLLETEVALTVHQKMSDFPWRVSLVFQIAPGSGKSYLHV